MKSRSQLLLGLINDTLDPEERELALNHTHVRREYDNYLAAQETESVKVADAAIETKKTIRRRTVNG